MIFFVAYIKNMDNQSMTVTKSKSSLFAKLFGMIFAIIILLCIVLVTLAVLHNQKTIDLSPVIDTLKENNLWLDWFDTIFKPREPDDEDELSVITAYTPTPTPTPFR